MASHGAEETERLKQNVQEQLNRLLTQLQDLEELRDEIDDDEYAEVRGDTLEQLKEFDAQLNRMAQGDLTLVSELGSIKLALEAAVREAFRTPEVIRLFARKEPTALRGRLARLGQEHRLGRLADAAFRSQAVEVIVALKRLGEELTADERQFLDASTDTRRQFEAADRAIGEAAVWGLAAAAGGGKAPVAAPAGRR